MSLIVGDLFDVLPTLDADSVDACVTDPPYELGFMGKHWDGSGVAFQPKTWCAVARVLKPGAHLLAFGGTRTFHRLTCAIEDAGFEIRDCLSYLYGSGFPKSTRPNRDPRFCQCAELGRSAGRTVREQPPVVRTDTEPVVSDDGPLFASVPRSTDAAEGSLVDCRPGCDSDDAPPLHSGADDRADVPSPEDALARIRSGERVDVSADAQARTLFPAQYTDRPSSPGLDGPDCSESADVGRTAASTSPADTCESQRRKPGKTQGVSCANYTTGLPLCLVCGKPNADGLGTALKPGWEPIILARKPLVGTVARNVQQYGTGALNVDACRIEAHDAEALAKNWDRIQSQHQGIASTGIKPIALSDYASSLGRWPPNVCLDEAAAALLDEQSGELASGDLCRVSENRQSSYGFKGDGATFAANSGGASRFYYVAKPSREERDYGCDALPAKTAGELTNRKEGSAGLKSPRAGIRAGSVSRQAADGSEPLRIARNHHPTVKPVELMRWLVKLVTPPGGVVLDPFAGSGTTGMACRYEQRQFIGIEREPEYAAIAERRIAAVAPLFGELSAGSEAK